MSIDNRKIAGIRKRLTNPKNQYRPCFGDAWWTCADVAPGVYAVFRNNRLDQPVYVGETSCLLERLRDLRNPVNHTFTSQINKRIFNGDGEIGDIREHIEENYVVAFVTVRFGRKETEEQLISYWETSGVRGENHLNKFNKKSPRWERSMAASNE